MLTLKSKIIAGFSLLFILVLFTGLTGIFFINKLANEAHGTIADNYHTVDYCMSMHNALDVIEVAVNRAYGGLDDYPEGEAGSAITSFKENLKREKLNITEETEADLVDEVEKNFNKLTLALEQLKAQGGNRDAIRRTVWLAIAQTRKAVSAIYDLNMKAIISKNEKLVSTAEEVTIWKITAVSSSIILALIFMIAFPRKVIKPLKELTAKIRLIITGKYHQRLDVVADDEIGKLAAAFNEMAEKLEAYEEQHYDQLLFEKRRIEALVESMEDGVMFIDDNNKIALVNSSMTRLTGMRKEEVTGSPVKDLAAQNNLISLLDERVTARGSGVDEPTAPIRVVSEGEELFFNARVETLVNYSSFFKREVFTGTLVIMQDVTQFHKRDAAKTNLLATVSHEFKTPLSSINLCLKLLEDKRTGTLNGEQREILSTLRGQSNRLSRVINELLEFSQIETGNIRLNIRKINPTDVMELSATALMFNAGEKQIEMVTELEESYPGVMGDIEKSVFVYVNLLNNAIRYSPVGGEIILQIRKEDNMVIFSVKDRGPGISRENVEKLFKRFSQIDPKSSKGWGLGLAIAKDFVAAQGGTIGVNSEPGKGSEFWFSLPVAKV